jgi:AhpC/TSA family
MNIRSLAFVAGFAAASAFAQAPGTAAPDFAITDVTGKPVKLSDYRGKYVVLEWTNPDCPFVRNQYNTRGTRPTATIPNSRRLPRWRNG